MKLWRHCWGKNFCGKVLTSGEWKSRVLRRLCKSPAENPSPLFDPGASRMHPSLFPRCSVSFFFFFFFSQLAFDELLVWPFRSEAWTFPEGFVVGTQPTYRSSGVFMFSPLSIQSPTVAASLGAVPRGTDLEVWMRRHTILHSPTSCS